MATRRFKKKERGVTSLSLVEQYLLFLPTIAGLLSRRKSVTGINMDNPRIVYLSTAGTNFHVGARLLIVSARLNRLRQWRHLLSDQKEVYHKKGRMSIVKHNILCLCRLYNTIYCIISQSSSGLMLYIVFYHFLKPFSTQLIDSPHTQMKIAV